jgi:hypothetical protein
MYTIVVNECIYPLRTTIMTNTKPNYRSVIIDLLPTKENIWKTRTDFRLLSNAVEIRWSQDSAIADVKVVDEYVFMTKEPMYFSLYFGEKR